MLAGPHRSCEQAQCAEYRPRTGVASAALAGPRPLNQSHNQLTSSVRPPLRLHLPKRRDASLSTPELKFETLSSDVGSRAGETVASSYRVPDCTCAPARLAGLKLWATASDTRKTRTTVRGVR